MSLTVCTGWSPAGWEIYGRQFLRTFDEFWPEDVALMVWCEQPPTDLPWFPNMRSNFSFHPLYSIPFCAAFLEKYKGNARANGREVLPTWKPSAKQAGYNWKFDAWKWSRQGFIPRQANMLADTDYLLWLDADVITHARVTEKKITDLMPAGKYFAYLGRGDKHPDIAFQLYRRGPAVEDFLMSFSEAYALETVFDLKEWHSAYVWKHCLEAGGFDELAHDLTPGGTGHVWFQSPLQKWGDHLKGARKNVGRSDERR